MNMKLYGFCKPSINPSLGWFPRTLGILLDWFHLISSHHFTLRNIWAKDVMEKSPYVWLSGGYLMVCIYPMFSQTANILSTYILIYQVACIWLHIHYKIQRNITVRKHDIHSIFLWSNPIKPTIFVAQDLFVASPTSGWDHNATAWKFMVVSCDGKMVV